MPAQARLWSGGGMAAEAVVLQGRRAPGGGDSPQFKAPSVGVSVENPTPAVDNSSRSPRDDRYNLQARPQCRIEKNFNEQAVDRKDPSQLILAKENSF
jgi:hypothetical protein